jgi:hypothetical protein
MIEELTPRTPRGLPRCVNLMGDAEDSRQCPNPTTGANPNRHSQCVIIGEYCWLHCHCEGCVCKRTGGPAESSEHQQWLSDKVRAERLKASPEALSVVVLEYQVVVKKHVCPHCSGAIILPKGG